MPAEKCRFQVRGLYCIKNFRGNFLYNTVRGLENDTFQPAKTHSISSESTYPYDLVDRDVIDTALLELCYTVMFRLLREKARSHSLGRVNGFWLFPAADGT